MAKFDPFYGWVVLHFIYVCTYIHHILMHSSIDGHLGCFHVLAIVNDAGFLKIYIYKKSGIAGSYGSSVFIFLRNFSPHPHQIYLCSFWQVWGNTSLWFWFWFVFPWYLVTLNIFVFSCAYWPSACPLWKNVYSGLLSIF